MIMKQRPVLAWTGRASRWLERRAERMVLGAAVVLAAFVAGAFYQMFAGAGQ